MSAVKNWFKKILPPPVNSFMREVNRIVALEEKNQAVMLQLIKSVEQQAQKIEWQENILQEQIKMAAQQKELLLQQEQRLMQLLEISEQKRLDTIEEYIGKQMEVLRDIKEQQVGIKRDAQAARNHAWQGQRSAEEIVWAEIFNNVTSNSSWLVDKSFSAGRWAVGYQYLYVVYRILNEIRPKNILELGLGQSTRLLAQYAAHDAKVQHTIVEHDPAWIQFFQQDFQLPSSSKIVQLEREYRAFREDDHVLAFKNFKETFTNQKFDFISIDAPLGGEAIVYARVDILDSLPEILAESFIIIVDDFNRQGEKNMVVVLEELLQGQKIAYAKGVYSGKKDCIVVCSKNLEFVCSM